MTYSAKSSLGTWEQLLNTPESNSQKYFFSDTMQKIPELVNLFYFLGMAHSNSRFLPELNHIFPQWAKQRNLAYAIFTIVNGFRSWKHQELYELDLWLTSPYIQAQKNSSCSLFSSQKASVISSNGAKLPANLYNFITNLLNYHLAHDKIPKFDWNSLGLDSLSTPSSIGTFWNLIKCDSPKGIS
jgi:hypothetical protein